MTGRSEEAKAELREAEQKLADAKAELARAEAKQTSAEAKQEQVEQKLMETKQADPANTAEIQRLEQKLQRLNHELSQLQLSLDSKRESVRSKEALVSGLERHWLSATVGSLSAAERGNPAMQSSAEQTQTAASHHQRAPLTISLSLSLSPSLFCPVICDCFVRSFSCWWACIRCGHTTGAQTVEGGRERHEARREAGAGRCPEEDEDG